MSPSVIARQFTLGQLFVISWWLNQRAEREAVGAGEGSVDLRTLTSAELQKHLATLAV